MKYIFPDYYSDFTCLADRCRHSCCIGWEIDIDDETYNYYQQLSGELGKRLKQHIAVTDGVPHFVLTKEERCPFLNQKGLCDLILQSGEDSLCQICADHPRFRSFFSDREEIGLGLCCEGAGQIILSRKEPVSFLTEETDEETDSLTEEEKAVLSLRRRLTEHMQNRSLSFSQRLNRLILTVMPAVPAFDAARWSKFFLSLERMDEAWTALLQKLPEAKDMIFDRNSQWDIPFEQLCVYLLFRHLPGTVEDHDMAGRILFCALICRLLGAFCAMEKEPLSMETLVEYARLYSSEIEYSDCNPDMILSELHRLYLF